MSARLRATLAGIAILALVWLVLGIHSAPPTLTFLAVGQGDAVVWQDAGVTAMVDVGPKTREGYDAGERIVLPKLRRMGIGRVDLIFVTHPDADHIGGLPAVANRFSESKIVLNAGFRENPDMVWWLREAGLKPERVLWVDGMSRFRFGKTEIEVAAPPVVTGSSDNEGSLFVRITRGLATAVLTGDAPIATEEAMEKRLKWSAQVLKAGHHGSRTSTSMAFVKSIGPTWAVISCGRDNRFDHPHKSVLETFATQSVEVFRTDLQGDISFQATDTGFIPLLRSATMAR